MPFVINFRFCLNYAGRSEAIRRRVEIGLKAKGK